MPSGADHTSSTERRSTQPRVWAFASGKGGVGKSLLAANLACLLAESDWSTTAVDLDTQGANLHTFLGAQEGGHGIDAYLSGQRSLADVRVAHEVPGLSYIGGHHLVGQGTSESGCARLRDDLLTLGDRAVVLDLGSGTSEEVLSWFRLADVPLLVVTPEPASVENAHRFLKALYVREARRVSRGSDDQAVIDEISHGVERRWQPGAFRAQLERVRPNLVEATDAQLEAFEPGLVLNMVRLEQDIQMAFGLVGAVRQCFGLRMKLLGAVHYDPDAWLAARRRKLLVRDVADETISAGLMRLADHVIEGGVLQLSDVVSYLPRALAAAGDRVEPPARS